MDDLVLSVVETEAVPRRMLAPVATIEVLTRIACQIAQSLCLVLHGMALNEVHDYGKSLRVGFVDETL